MAETKTIQNNSIEIPQTPFGFFWFVSKPYKLVVFGAVMAVMIGASLDQGSAYFFKLIVESIEQGNYEATLRYALLYPCVVLLIQVTYRASGVFGGTWSTKANKHAMTY